MNGVMVTAYHGTNITDIVEFRTDGRESNGAIFFSHDKEYAEEAAYVKKQYHGGKITLYKADLLIRYPYVVRLAKGKFADCTVEKKYIEYAKAEGFDGVIFYNDEEEEPDVFYAVFSPSQIRMREKIIIEKIEKDQ